MIDFFFFFFGTQLHFLFFSFGFWIQITKMNGKWEKQMAQNEQAD